MTQFNTMKLLRLVVSLVAVLSLDVLFTSTHARLRAALWLVVKTSCFQALALTAHTHATHAHEQRKQSPSRAAWAIICRLCNLKPGQQLKLQRHKASASRGLPVYSPDTADTYCTYPRGMAWRSGQLHYKDGLLALRRSPIQVLTGLDVDYDGTNAILAIRNGSNLSHFTVHTHNTRTKVFKKDTKVLLRGAFWHTVLFYTYSSIIKKRCSCNRMFTQ